MRITILLPTYNGKTFLAEQLDSLLKQTYDDWICIIRDDGSNDNSIAMAESYMNRFPMRFIIVKDNFGNLGTVGSINILAKYVESPLFGFCDQDDIWVPEKLEVCINSIKSHEYLESEPVLCYCDMMVTDQSLRLISTSFWDYINVRKYAVELKGLPVINAVAGCSMIGNRALLEAAFPIPVCAPMHDYWVGLVAKFAGHTVMIENPLVLYRQHNGNQLGAGTRVNFLSRIKRRIFNLESFFEDGLKSRKTRILMLNELLNKELNTIDFIDCSKALEVEQGNWIERLNYLHMKGIHPHHAYTYWLT